MNVFILLTISLLIGPLILFQALDAMNKIGLKRTMYIRFFNFGTISTDSQLSKLVEIKKSWTGWCQMRFPNVTYVNFVDYWHSRRKKINKWQLEREQKPFAPERNVRWKLKIIITIQYKQMGSHTYHSP